MLRYKLSVNDQTRSLIQTIRRLRFGEIYGVEIALGGDTSPIDLSKNEFDLVKEIENGLQSIDMLTIHNGEPVLAEVDYKDNCFRCRKKVKFPTVPTEG